MKRLLSLAVSTAAALLTSAFVVAQDQKAATVTVEVKVQKIARPAANEKVAVEKKVEVGKEQKVAKKAVDAKQAKAEAEEKALDPIIQQFVPQLRPFFRSELHLVASVCGPTKEQREALAKQADATTKDVARGFAKSQQAMQMGRFQGGGSNNPDPRALMQAAMLKLVKDHLTPEQVARYTAEVEKRAADRKQVSINNIVAQMDIDLVLAADQRDKIAAALSKDWNDAWGQSLEVYLYGSQFLPNIPSKITDPHLNDAQKKVWRDTPRGQNIFFGGIGFLGGMVVGGEVEEVLVQPEPAPQGVTTKETITIEVKADEPNKAEAQRTTAAKVDEPKKTEAEAVEVKKVEAKKVETKKAGPYPCEQD